MDPTTATFGALLFVGLSGYFLVSNLYKVGLWVRSLPGELGRERPIPKGLTLTQALSFIEESEPRLLEIRGYKRYETNVLKAFTCLSCKVLRYEAQPKRVREDKPYYWDSLVEDEANWLGYLCARCYEAETDRKRPGVSESVPVPISWSSREVLIATEVRKA